MKQLINYIQALKKSNIASTIKQRMREFRNQKDVFSELCFCLMTANYSAEGGIRIQYAIGEGFYDLSEKDLANKLKKLGHRFPNARAKYICNARDLDVRDALKNLTKDNLRDWLVNNVKGLGMKEASHFLRNIGYKDYAIIDFHIIDLLVREKLIERPKTLTKKKYLEIEDVLRTIGEKVNLNLAELDLYLWYLETGKVLK
jgi:N-glycosylase/DNA lyase